MPSFTGFGNYDEVTFSHIVDPEGGTDINLHLTEALIIAQEECAEVSQEISKILRFGWTEETKVRLENEIGDLMALIDYLSYHDFIDTNKVSERMVVKMNKLSKWSRNIH